MPATGSYPAAHTGTPPTQRRQWEEPGQYDLEPGGLQVGRGRGRGCRVAELGCRGRLAVADRSGTASKPGKGWRLRGQSAHHRCGGHAASKPTARPSHSPRVDTTNWTSPCSHQLAHAVSSVAPNPGWYVPASHEMHSDRPAQQRGALGQSCLCMPPLPARNLHAADTAAYKSRAANSLPLVVWHMHCRRGRRCRVAGGHACAECQGLTC